MKLLAIFTGGTISCTEQEGALSPSAVQPFLLLERRPEISFDALTERTAQLPQIELAVPPTFLGMDTVSQISRIQML